MFAEVLRGGCKSRTKGASCVASAIEKWCAVYIVAHRVPVIFLLVLSRVITEAAVRAFKSMRLAN